MDGSSRAGQLERLRAHCLRPPRAVLFDEEGGVLLDVASGKTLPLRLPDLVAVETLSDRETGRPYLRLGFGDGTQLALTDSGVAFSPVVRNSGPVSLPAAVCFRDFRTVLDRLKHELYGHPDQPPTRDTVMLPLLCIAILDGAREHGFEVGREEAELEAQLAELERRGPGRP